MSDLAKQLIAENKRTRDPFLDLGNCGLTEIPEEIDELAWVESLSFARSWFEWNGTRWAGRSSQNGGERNLLEDVAPLARLTGLRTLILTGTPITDLAPLASLASLQSLEVSGTQVSDLAPLQNLACLQSLLLSNTEVSDLAPLANLPSLYALSVSDTQVTDLAPLANLASLQSLEVWGTQVSDLAPLANVPSLQWLTVTRTQVSDLAPLASLASLQLLYIARTPVSDLAPLAHLASLKFLHLSDTQVGDLAPLANLTSLESLDVARTPVSDLAPLANLASLKMLNVSDTQVGDLAPLLELVRRGLPVKWSSQSWKSDGIYVENCPLTNPPQAIAAQGNEAILNYFTERARGGVDHLYEAKMLVLGEGGAGKTSLIRRLYQPEAPLPAAKDTTRGIEICKREFKLKNGRTFRLNVWDFGGQQIYHATHQFFLTGRSLYVLLDDTRKDYKSVSDEGFRYWLELIEVFGGHSPTLIFQNEKDGRTKAIDFRGIVQQYDNVKELFGGNLERANAADRVRDAIEYFAANLNHIGEELPAKWIEVRAEIERVAAARPYVPVEEYFNIYGRHLEFDETKALHLSRYLHDLGVFLHFQDDPLLKRTVILQNEWVTTAVFRVLDDEVVKKELGRFDHKDCARLWKGTGYDYMHPELLALMQNFELCYALRDFNPPAWLAPQLLPPTKPEKLVGWARPGDLILRYKYDFLPKGMISRLTVRQHRFVRNPEMAWVTGVLFEQDSTAVLVEVLPGGDEIEVRSRGTEDKALLIVISSDLDAMNDSFKGLHEKVHKRIPCNCTTCRSAASPHFYEHKELLTRKERGKRTIECSRPNYEEVEVLQLLEGVKAAPPPAWAKDTPKAEPLCVLRVFLASSSELRVERDDFELYFRQQNDQLRSEGIYLEIIRWENFLDAMSETRLQDEYNKQVRTCDVFVSLFFTKAGRYTEEEFDVAYGQFKNSDRPLVYTYFKNADVKIGELRLDDFASLRRFMDKVKDYGHFYTEYTNIEGLKLHFRDQLPMIREKLRI